MASVKKGHESIIDMLEDQISEVTNLTIDNIEEHKEQSTMEVPLKKILESVSFFRKGRKFKWDLCYDNRCNASITVPIKGEPETDRAEYRNRLYNKLAYMQITAIHKVEEDTTNTGYVYKIGYYKPETLKPGTQSTAWETRK